MTAESYGAFSKPRDELHNGGVSNIARVFVPVGPGEDDARPCLMFVGRATRDYDDERVATFEGSKSRNLEIIQEQHSPFWAFMRRILHTVTLDMGHDPNEGSVMSVAWSNLAKIGDVKGNPTPLSCSIQATSCQEALELEIEALGPAAIVVATGMWQKQTLLDPVFGSDGWSDHVSPPTRSKVNSPSGALVVQTYHPQAKRGGRDMAMAIGRMIADHLRNVAR